MLWRDFAAVTARPNVVVCMHVPTEKGVGATEYFTELLQSEKTLAKVGVYATAD